MSRLRTESLGGLPNIGHWGLNLLGGSTKASFSVVIGINGLKQHRLAEIRPKFICEIKLSVRQLPQQEIGYSLLATSTDEKVWLGAALQAQMSGKISFRNLIRIVGQLGIAFQHAFCRLENIPAAAVIGCNV